MHKIWNKQLNLNPYKN